MSTKEDSEKSLWWDRILMWSVFRDIWRISENLRSSWNFENFSVRKSSRNTNPVIPKWWADWWGQDDDDDVATSYSCSWILNEGFCCTCCPHNLPFSLTDEALVTLMNYILRTFATLCVCFLKPCRDSRLMTPFALLSPARCKWVWKLFAFRVDRVAAMIASQ